MTVGKRGPASGTRNAYMRAAMLGGFRELVEGNGLDPVRLAARVGIPARALHDPDMLISWHAMGTLMEIAASELRKPHLGLEWMRFMPAPLLNFGPLGLLARFSATLGEWCVISRDYWRFQTNAYAVNLHETVPGRELTLRFTADEVVPPSRHQMEYTIAGVCRFIRMLVPIRDHQFICIRFRHLEPDDTSLHREMFRCPVEFGSTYDELVYAAEVDDYPIDDRIEVLADFFDHYVASRSANVPGFDGSVRAAVEVAVPSLIGTGCCTLGHIARLLDIGPKTLQRQLAKEGTRFADILDRSRERLARQFLVESDAPIEGIAGLLGYARTPPFTFAFKRWTGMSPRQYRKMMQARDERT